MGEDVTPRQRLDMWAYLLAGKTEFWRAHRHYAGVIHFVYLTCSYPGVYTSDHFADVTTLQLDPAFADYVSEAFKPLGVYINFFQPRLEKGSQRSFRVMLVNDYASDLAGELELALLDGDGNVMVTQRQEFQVAPAGDAAYDLTLNLPPQAQGNCTLRATARPVGVNDVEPTVCRRWVSVE
jgi:hypothetical protein